jgi:hypothetical protein
MMEAKTCCKLINKKHLYDGNPSTFICKRHEQYAALQDSFYHVWKYQWFLSRDLGIYSTNFCSDKLSTFHWIRGYNKPIKIKTEFITQLLLGAPKTKFNWVSQSDSEH